MFAASLLLSVLAGASHQSQYLMELKGVPVGTVTLELDAGHYRYRSRHLYTAALRRVPLVREEHVEVRETGERQDGGPAPASLWLWREPPEGCVALQEELTGERGRGCVEHVYGPERRGVLMGQAFTATYDAEGWLRFLTVGTTVFRANRGAALATPEDVFGVGFPIRGTRGPPRLVPPAADPGQDSLEGWNIDSAQKLARQVHDDHANPQDGCLDIAQDFILRAARQGHRVALVYGLWVDGARAYPHAWVRIGLGRAQHLDLDPTLLDEVRPETHLPLGARVGEVYLGLAEGRYHLERNP